MLKKQDLSRNFIKILKIAAGTGLSIFAADRLGLSYSASAGVITLLSIQDTKKETIRVILRRLVSFGAALFLASVFFPLFGFGAWGVAVFLVFFSAFCILFHMQEGISVNTVLMTHFLTEGTMNAYTVGNEMALLVIGTGMGMILNLYIPGKKKQIRRNQQQIEDQMREILKNMAAFLGTEKSLGTEEFLETEKSLETEKMRGRQWMEENLRPSLKKLDGMLKQGEKSAFEDMENQLLSETRYYLQYMNMRKMQSLILYRIEESLGRLKALPVQAQEISLFLQKVGATFSEYNNVTGLQAELHQVKNSMRGQPLPAAREEFESRAVLFQILLELEEFLMIKRVFVEELTEEELAAFWKCESSDTQG